MRNFAFLLSAFFLAVCTVSGQTWTSMNSPTGFKNVRDFTTNSTGVTLYGADEVNLLKSTDTGKTWAATSSAVSSPVAVTTKNDNSDIVLVSGSNFFKRSTNGGSSWTDLLTGTTNKPTALANFPQNTTQMLLGRKYGSTSEKAIARSTDAGVTWTDELSSTYKPKIFDIAINVSTAYPGYAAAAGAPDGAVATGRGIFFTEDYGDVWTPRVSGTGDPRWTAVAVAYNLGTVNTVWAGTTDGKLYKAYWKATDANWVLQSAFPPGHNFADTVRCIRIDPGNYSVVYVATDRSIYKTTNNGTNWSCVYASAMTDSRSYTLELNPSNSSQVLLGTLGFIYRSTNAASSWTSSTTGTTRTIPLFSVVASGSNAWPVSNELTVAMKYNGSSWSTLRVGHKDSTFFGKHSDTWLNGSSSRYVFQSGIQDNTSAVYLSQDDGASYGQLDDFKTTTPGTMAEGVIADPSKVDKVFAFGKLKNGTSDRNYFISTDYGLTWDKTTGGVTSAAWLALAPLGDGQGAGGVSKFIYAGVNLGGLLRTQNTASTWPNVSTSTIGLGVKVNAVVSNPKKITTAYAGTTGGLLFSINADHSTDGSVLFTNNWSAAEVKRILIDPRFTNASYRSIYVFWVASTNVVYRSEDSGKTALSVVGNLPSGIVVNDLRSDPSDTTLLYIASDRGIYKAQLLKPPTLNSLAYDSTKILYCIVGTENLAFTWSAVSGATSYDFQLDDNSDFSSTLVSTNLSTNQYSYSSDLTCNTTYYWRVRSSDGTNFGKSPYSASYRFTTSACSPPQLSAPTLISPTDGQQGVSAHPVLIWNASTGGEVIKYWINGSWGSQYVAGTSTSLGLSGLSCNTWYTWSVKAINCNGSNPASATWSFKTALNCQEGPEGPQTTHSGSGENGVVTDFQLKQNHPNPFNPTTRFDYALPEAAQVRLRIFNTLGQVVATVVDRYEEAGWKSAEFDASRQGGIPSGLYFYRLEAGRFSAMKKMLLLK